LIQDESNDTPTPEEEEGVEPTAAPDETPGVPEGEPTEDPGAAPDETLSEAPAEEPVAEAPAEEAPAEDAPAEDAAAEAPAAEAPAADAPAADAPAADAAAGEAAEQRAPKPKREAKSDEPEVIPGAHLEPDLVLDQPAADDSDQYAQYADDGDEDSDTTTSEPEAPVVRSPLELAADARYQATGKRKTAIARVILKPGNGVYVVNGKTLEEYFPRPRLQTQARQPLDATGNLSRMDVIARIHGGGVSAQASALRHGIARALVEAEPTLRTELKRRGYLTRDPREKERKKAGLKKARKRPQFSKR
jgi:small subunit ribosomal protein S9